MKKLISFYFFLLKTSIKASMSKKEAFLIESGLMIANNLIFFSIWWFFFQEFRDIDGWKFDDMAALMAIGTGSYGLNQILFAGGKRISKIILQGDLDPFMVKPKNILFHILGSQSYAKGWGHLMTAIILMTFNGLLTLTTLPIFLISIFSGSLVFSSIMIIAHSLPFWFGSVESLSKKYCDSLFLFALYPTNIYSGLLQIVMFTVIPAGIITYIPVELVRSFSWSQLILLIASSTTLFSLAAYIFYSGLKRYESGNKFGIHN